MSSCLLRSFACFFLFCLLQHSASSANECYSCRSVCLHASSPEENKNEVVDSSVDELLAKIERVNLHTSACRLNCENFGKETPRFDCGADKHCYTASANVKFQTPGKTEGSSQYVNVTYFQRGCVPVCPSNALCDLKLPITNCGYPKPIADKIKENVDEGKEKLIEYLKDQFAKVITEVDSFGHIQCCDGPLCNTEKNLVETKEEQQASSASDTDAKVEL